MSPTGKPKVAVTNKGLSREVVTCLKRVVDKMETPVPDDHQEHTFSFPVAFVPPK